MKKTVFKTNHSGITLVALVVTILVLIILAGISITALTGENGIINKAIEAREATELSQLKEELLERWYAFQNEHIKEYLTTKETAEKFQTYLRDTTEDGNATVSYNDANETFEVSYMGHEFEISAINDKITNNREVAKNDVQKAWNQAKNSSSNREDQINKLRDLIQSLNPDSTVTYDPDTGKITVTHNGYNVIIDPDDEGGNSTVYIPMDIEVAKQTVKEAWEQAKNSSTNLDEQIAKLEEILKKTDPNTTVTYDPDTGKITVNIGGRTVIIDTADDSITVPGEEDENNSGTIRTERAEVEISAAPSSAEVFAGSTAEFKVDAEGPNLTYQWFVNDVNRTVGGTAIPGATSATYSFDASIDDNGKYYYCLITSTYKGRTANEKTPPVLLTVINKLTSSDISISPDPEQTVLEENSATFTVSAQISGLSEDTSSSHLTYQWYKNTSNSNEGGTEITGATSTTYTINSVTQDDDLYYYCEVTETSGLSGQTVGAETFTIATNTSKLNVKIPQAIVLQPIPSTSAIAGHEASIFVRTRAKGTIKYTWYHNNTQSTEGGTEVYTETKTTPLSESEIIEGADEFTYDSIYKINETAMADNGYYYCVIEQSYTGSGSTETLTDTVTTDIAQIIVTPQVTTTDPEDAYKLEGNTATFSITATGNANNELTYQWYRNSTNSNEGGTEITGATSSSYTTPATTVADDDGSYYYCITTQVYGSPEAQTQTVTSGVAKLTVKARTEVAISPSSINVIEKQKDVSYTATATGAGHFKFKWYETSTNTLVYEEEFSNEESDNEETKTSTFTIEKDDVLKTLAGNTYNCVITQTYYGQEQEETTDTVSLTVVDHVSITNPEDQYKIETSTQNQNTNNIATFTATATGETNESLTFKWYKSTDGTNENGTEITSDDTYTITTTQNGGSASNVTSTLTVSKDKMKTDLNNTTYYCVVTQTYGGTEGSPSDAHTATVTSTSSTATLYVVPAVDMNVTTDSTQYRLAGNEVSFTSVVKNSAKVSGKVANNVTYKWYKNSSNTTTGATEITAGTGRTISNTSNAVESTLTYSSPATTDSGYYFLVATQTYHGETAIYTTSISQLTVVSNVSITQAPTAVYVVAGISDRTDVTNKPDAAFTVQASGLTSPDTTLAVEWYYKATSTATPVRAASESTRTNTITNQSAGTLTSTYTIPASDLATTDSGYYYAVVKQVYYGQNSSASTNDSPNTAALLTAVAPVTITNPGNVTVTEGNTATFTATGTGISSPALTYQWYKSDNANKNADGTKTDGEAISGATSATYTTPKVTQDYNTKPYYYCVVTQVYGDPNQSTVTATSDAAKLTVGTDMSITDPEDVKAIENSDADIVLSSKATGSGTFEFTWYKSTDGTNQNGTEVSSSRVVPTTSVTPGTGNSSASYTSTYTIPKAEIATSDSGYYYCKVKQTYGDSTKTLTSEVANIDVIAHATYSINYTDVRVITGKKDVTFQVTADDKGGSVTYQWYTNTLDASNKTTTGATKITGATTNSYTINKSATTGANYYAVATQKYGISTYTIPVTTADIASLSIVSQVTATNPSAQTKIAGKSASFSTTASGQGTLTYQWYEKDTSSNVTTLSGNGASGSLTSSNSYKGTYTIPAVSTTQNGYQYYAIVTQVYGSSTPAGYLTTAERTVTKTTSTAMLSVTAGPEITSQPASESRIAGDTATFTFAVDGKTGTTSYKWYYNNTNSNSGGTEIAANTLGSTNTGYTYNSSPTTGATSSTLSLANIPVAWNGKYVYCEATQSYGDTTQTLTSNAVSVSVTPKAKIKVQPTAQTATEGLTATFSIELEAQNSGETLDTSTISYQWYRKPASGSASAIATTNGSGSQTASYTTPALNTYDDYNNNKYYVVVTQKYGNTNTSGTDTAWMLTSNEVTLTVNKVELSMNISSWTPNVSETTTATITYKIGGNNASVTSLTAESTNTNVATVERDGNTVTIKALAAGTATITITEPNVPKTATITVTVGKATPTITLSSTSGNVDYLNTNSFTATASLSGSAVSTPSGKWTITSSDTSKVTIQAPTGGTASNSTQTTVTYYGASATAKLAGDKTVKITVKFTPTDTTNFDEVTFVNKSDSNYDGYKVTQVNTIKATAPTLANKSGTYDGSTTYYITKSADGVGGTLKYRTSTASATSGYGDWTTWTGNGPGRSAAGTTYVQAYRDCSSDNNYTDSDIAPSSSTAATISVSATSYTVTPANGSGTYDGDTAYAPTLVVTDVSGTELYNAQKINSGEKQLSDYTGVTVYWANVEMTQSGTNKYDTKGSTTIPTRTDAGTTSPIYWYVKSNSSNYSDKGAEQALKIEVAQKDINGATITVADQSWTGSALTPNPTSVTKDGKTLALTTDYTVTNHSNNTAPGTAGITITGRGNYKGTATGSFTIVDNTKPVVEYVTRTDYNTFKWKATDGVGVTAYAITNSASTPSTWTTITSTTNTGDQTYDINASTANTYYVWAKDAKGNISDAKSITSYTLTKTQNTGTTLTIKENSSSGAALISSATGSTCVLDGTTIYVEVSQTSGYNNAKVTVGGNDFTSGNTTTITSNTAVVSTATANTATVTINRNNSAWSNSDINVSLRSAADATSDSKTYASSTVDGATVKWSAIPNGTYYIFAGRNSDDASTMVYTDKTIVVNNNAATQTISYYVLTLTAGDNVASVTGAKTYLNNQTASISATADTNYTFKQWTVNSGNTPASTTAASTTVSMSQATSLTAVASDQTKPTATASRNNYNTISWEVKDAVALAGYKITTTNTQPTTWDAASGTSKTGTYEINASTAQTYYVWAKDTAGNVSVQVAPTGTTDGSYITSYKITKTEGTGTTLTIKENNASGANLGTTCVLNGTTIYVAVEATTGYESPTVTVGGNPFTSGNTTTITNNTEIVSSVSASVYTITLNNEDATTPGTTAIYEKYNAGYYTNSGCTTQLLPTNSNTITVPTKTGYVFGGYYTQTEGAGTQYIGTDGKLTSSASNTNFTAEGTLYAKWTANTATVTVKSNGSAWANNGISVSLRESASATADITTGTAKTSGTSSTVSWSAVPNGTYYIFAGKNELAKNDMVSTGTTIQVNNNQATQEIKYNVLTLTKGSNISKVTVETTDYTATTSVNYLENQTANIGATPNTNYTFTGWTKTSGNAPASTTLASTTVSMSQATSLTANAGDDTKPTATITKTDYNTFAWSVGDAVGLEGYKITTDTTAEPTTWDAATGTQKTGSQDIDASNPHTYRLWSKDSSGNVCEEPAIITSHTLSKTQNTGTTLTIKETNSSGTTLISNATGSTSVLENTVIYVTVSNTSGYNTATVKVDGEDFTSGDTYTIASATGTPNTPRSVPVVSNATANTATVTLNNNAVAWTNNGISVSLRAAQNATTDITTGTAKTSGTNSSVSWSAVPNGTYYIFAGTSNLSNTTKSTKVYTGKTIVVSNNAASQTINYYTLTLTAGVNVTSVSGAGTYLNNQSASIDATLNADCVFNAWAVNSGNTPTSTTTKNTTVSMSKATSLTASAKAPGTATVSMANWTYGETPSEPEYSSETNVGVTPTITYKVSTAADSTYTSTKPSNAGTYTIRAVFAATTTYQEVTATNTFTINKATISPTLSMAGYTWGGTKSTPSVNSGNPGNGTPVFYYSSSNVTSGGANWSEVTSSTYLNAGTYYMYAVVPETDNYQQGQTATQSFVITKATISPTLSMAGYTWGGTKSTPSVSSGNPGNGTPTYYYSSSNVTSGGTEWSTVTSSTQLNAGTYYMYAVVPETTNYKQGQTATQSFEIAKKAPSFSLDASTMSITYLNTNTLTISYDGDGAVTAGSSDTSKVTVSTSTPTITSGTGKITLSAVGAGSATITISAAEGTNYAAGTNQTCTVTVGQAEMTITKGNYGTASAPETYDGNPHGITLTVTTPSSGVAIGYSSTGPISASNYNSSTGTWSGNGATATKPTYTDASSSTRTTYWCVIDTNGNYATETGSNTVVIQKANISPTVSMTGYAYGDTKNDPTISGNTGNGTVTYYYNTSNSNSGGTAWTNVTDGTSLNAGTYYMYATVATTTNYNAATTATAQFVIGQRDISSDDISIDVTLDDEGSASFTYTGNTQTPKTVTVKDAGIGGTSETCDWCDGTSVVYKYVSDCWYCRLQWDKLLEGSI